MDLDSADWTLYDYIDPDSLDSLFDHEGNTITSLEFMVKGKTVTVWQDGEVNAEWNSRIPCKGVFLLRRVMLCLLVIPLS